MGLGWGRPSHTVSRQRANDSKNGRAARFFGLKHLGLLVYVLRQQNPSAAIDPSTGMTVAEVVRDAGPINPM